MARKIEETSSDTPSPMHIVEAERIHRGLLITFESGEIAFYSAALLHRHLSSADAFDPAKEFIRPA